MTEIGAVGLFVAIDDEGGIDLQALANQLFAERSSDGPPGGSFEMGKLLQVGDAYGRQRRPRR